MIAWSYDVMYCSRGVGGGLRRYTSCFRITILFLNAVSFCLNRLISDLNYFHIDVIKAIVDICELCVDAIVEDDKEVSS